MDVVRERLDACGLNSIDPIGQNGTEDLDHLPITVRLTLQLVLHASQSRWQIPVFKGCAVA